MPAYLVGQISVRDETLWKDYVAGVGESLAPFGARILFRGRLVSVLAGEHSHDRAVVIEFADMATLNNWFHSDMYQSIIPIRDEAADVVITAYETHES